MALEYFGFFGSGGFARETMQIARYHEHRWAAEGLGSPVYVEPLASDGQVLFGRAVITEERFFAQPGKPAFCVPVADADLRRKITERAISRGARPMSIVHPSSVISPDAEIGEGSIFSAYTVVTSDCRIGAGFHANLYTYVAHDCIIGDYVTCAPRASINGGVVVEDNVYIGTGAIIRQGTPSRPITIGRGSIVGMGAVVTRDVAPGSTVVGNPARPLQ